MPHKNPPYFSTGRAILKKIPMTTIDVQIYEKKRRVSLRAGMGKNYWYNVKKYYAMTNIIYFSIVTKSIPNIVV